MQMNDFVTGVVKASELKPNFRVTARITAVGKREFEDGTKPVIFLDCFGDRGLILNQANLKTLITAFDSDSEKWEGREVTVFRALADFKGSSVPAIRLEALRPTAIEARFSSGPQEAPPFEADPNAGRAFYDDGIPF